MLIPSLSILIVDDHPLFRTAMRDVLQSMRHPTSIVEASDGFECLDLLEKAHFDLVLLDINMPEMDGVGCLKEIRLRYPMLKVAVLTQYDDTKFYDRILSLGASGYLLKSLEATEIIESIEAMMFQDKLITSRQAEEKRQRAQSILSPRELEVILLICEGLSTNRIADVLSISPYTVNGHRASLERKIGSNKVSELVKWTVKNGFMSLS